MSLSFGLFCTKMAYGEKSAFCISKAHHLLFVKKSNLIAISNPGNSCDVPNFVVNMDTYVTFPDSAQVP
jgi:hypothetical protein